MQRGRRCLINTLEDGLLEQIFCKVECRREVRSLSSPRPRPGVTPPACTPACAETLEHCAECLRYPSPQVMAASFPTLHGSRRLMVLPCVSQRWACILGRPGAAWEHAEIELACLVKDRLPRPGQPFLDARVVAAWFGR